MASSTSSAAPSSSTTSDPYPSDNRQTGISAATYYGAVALAILVIAAVTIASRILYTRRLRALARSRGTVPPNSNDPSFSVDPSDPNAPPSYALQAPARAHTRRRRQRDIEEGEGLPAYVPAPPKYEEAGFDGDEATSGEAEGSNRASMGGAAGTGTAAANGVEAVAEGQQMTERRPGLSRSTSAAAPAPATAADASADSAPPVLPRLSVASDEAREWGEIDLQAAVQPQEEEFIHPEERRRNEALRNGSANV